MIQSGDDVCNEQQQQQQSEDLTRVLNICTQLEYMTNDTDTDALYCIETLSKCAPMLLLQQHTHDMNIMHITSLLHWCVVVISYLYVVVTYVYVFRCCNDVQKDYDTTTTSGGGDGLLLMDALLVQPKLCALLASVAKMLLLLLIHDDNKQQQQQQQLNSVMLAYNDLCDQLQMHEHWAHVLCFTVHITQLCCCTSFTHIIVVDASSFHETFGSFRIVSS